jgi:hypothetical protein
LGEVIISVITWEEQPGSHEMITTAPGCSLYIIGNCPHFFGRGGGLSCKALLFLRDSFQSLVLQMLLNPRRCFWNPRWLQSDCRGAKTNTKQRQDCQAFLLLLVNSWDQVGS